jgi:hypothetical protein
VYVIHLPSFDQLRGLARDASPTARSSPVPFADLSKIAND